ncbi:MAG: long-chain fatty acid--CoA ligase [Steroidobacteraceae bacterium]
MRLTPGRDAYRQFDIASHAWVSYSWADVLARVGHWRAALVAENLPVGARIGILVPNSVEHVCLDQAALASGYACVPLHVIDNPESLAYVIADSGASVLVVDSAARWAALAPFQAQFSRLQRVVYLGKGEPAASGIALCIDDWLARADGSMSPTPGPQPISPDALAAIVYTSGTTGRPKGVMLSHRNILSNVNSILAAMPVNEDDVLLSFLPLSHTFERTVGYYLPIAAGATVAYARSISQLMEDLVTIKPTILVSVPRIYERAYAALRETVEGSWLKKQLFDWAVDLGWRQFEYDQGRGRASSLPARLLYSLLDPLVGKPLRARFGGRLRAAVTGGAALAPEVARPFLALGVTLLQGYGMTESAPVIACNTPDDNEPASVGRPVSGVSVRVGDRDELLARGANVMMGYWQRPTETALAVDPQGWLHTGDQAQLKDGRVYIKGRIKDIIVTSTGEKIAPADLETAIGGDPMFDQVMVLGEQRPYLVALVVLNATRWAQQARELGLDPQTADLRAVTATHWVLERIGEALRAFPSYATPRAVWLSLEPWTVGAGLITPTLKPKRLAIQARFAAEIAELYRGH